MNFIDNRQIYLGISKKPDGSMETFSAKRLLFFKNKNLGKKIIISAELVNSNRVAIIDNLNKNKVIADCDALITSDSRYLLTVTAADCLPIYFYDRNKKVVAIAHAGWRGVLLEIAKEVIGQFTGHYGSALKDIDIFLGPHIRACHFEVQEDVACQFKNADSIVRAGKKYLDLSKIIKEQLLGLGIPKNNISISQECTYCLSNKYYSFRRDKPKKLKMMVAYLGLK